MKHLRRFKGFEGKFADAGFVFLSRDDGEYWYSFEPREEEFDDDFYYPKFERLYEERPKINMEEFMDAYNYHANLARAAPPGLGEMQIFARSLGEHGFAGAAPT